MPDHLPIYTIEGLDDDDDVLRVTVTCKCNGFRLERSWSVSDLPSERSERNAIIQTMGEADAVDFEFHATHSRRLL